MSTQVLTRPPELQTSRRPHSRERDSGRSIARLSRLGQVVLGLIWLIDGILQFQPYMFGKTFVTGVILPNATGQPGIIAAPITWIANLIEPHMTAFNAFAATLQVLIGLGLLYRRTVKPALLVSFVWAIGIWFSGEGLGLIFTGTASPLTGAPGAALLYVIAGLICWPRERGAAAAGLIGERGARFAWAAIWLGSAALWLLPANDSSNGVHDAIAAVPTGAGWLTQLLSSAATATAGRGTEIAIVMAIVSATIGVGVLRNRHAKPLLVTAIVISLVYWVFGQALGGVFTGQATDVNAAPLMILIASLLLALQPAAALASARTRAASRSGAREVLAR